MDRQTNEQTLKVLSDTIPRHSVSKVLRDTGLMELVHLKHNQQCIRSNSGKCWRQSNTTVDGGNRSSTMEIFLFFEGKHASRLSLPQTSRASQCCLLPLHKEGKCCWHHPLPSHCRWTFQILLTFSANTLICNTLKPLVFCCGDKALLANLTATQGSGSLSMSTLREAGAQQFCTALKATGLLSVCKWKS